MQEPDKLIALGYLCFQVLEMGRPRKSILVYMYIYTYTHRHLYLFLYFPPYIEKQEFILISPILLQNHRVRSRFSLVFYLSSPTVRNLTPIIFSILIYSIPLCVANLWTSLATAPLRYPPCVDSDPCGPATLHR